MPRLLGVETLLAVPRRLDFWQSMRHVGPVVKTIGAVARIAFKRKEICRGERYWEIEEASELTRYRTLLTAKRYIAMESAINKTPSVYIVEGKE